MCACFVCLGFGSANFCASGLGCCLSVDLGIDLVERFGVLLGFGLLQWFRCCGVCVLMGVCSGWFIAGFVSLLLLYCFNSVVTVLTLLFDWFNCLLILVALVWWLLAVVMWVLFGIRFSGLPCLCMLLVVWLFVAGYLYFGWFSVACMLFCGVCVIVAAFRLLLIVLDTSHIGASCFSGWCLLLRFLALWFIGFRLMRLLCARLIVVLIWVCWFVWLIGVGWVFGFAWLLCRSLLSLL